MFSSSFYSSLKRINHVRKSYISLARLLKDGREKKMKARTLKLAFAIASMITLTMSTISTLFSPATAQIGENPRWGGTLIISAHDDPTTLNQDLTTIESAGFVSHNIFSPLIVYDFDFQPQPNLATSWSISADGLSYTFNLVENATWHDGEPVTSADVKFTMEEVVMEYSPWGEKIFVVVDEVETPDDYTVVFKLNAPSAVFMLAMNFYYFVPLPKHLYEGTDILENPYNIAPIGCGPYKFVEWVRGDHITLERNENYWKKNKPYFDRVVCRIVPDPATADLMLEKGEIDLIPVTVLSADVNRLMANPNIIVGLRDTAGSSVVETMVFNTLEGHITADPRVRRAIAYAINTTSHIEKVEFGHATENNKNPFTPLIDWCYNGDPWLQYAYDVTKANELLDAAGYERGPDGIRFTLELRAGSWYRRYYKDAEVMIPELEAIGIAVNYVTMERSVFNEQVFGNYEYDIISGLGYTVAPDPTIGQERYLHTKAITALPWVNVAHYSNPDVDELLDKARTEANQTKRKEYFFEIQEILAEDMPYIGLYSPHKYSAWTNEIVGLPKGPFNTFEPDDTVWFKDQHKYSPEMCEEAIASAEQKIDELEDTGYDVSQAESKLEDAETALAARDYTLAKESADWAPALAIPPGPGPIPGDIEGALLSIDDRLEGLTGLADLLMTILAIVAIIAIGGFAAVLYQQSRILKKK